MCGRLHSRDIEKFAGEIRSRGASTGVICCNTGFAERALQKAEAHGIACCCSHENESPDIPCAIWFEHYACSTCVRLAVRAEWAQLECANRGNLFDLEVDGADVGATVLDLIGKAYAQGEGQAVESAKATGSVPLDWAVESSTKLTASGLEVHVEVHGHWKRYKAKAEATLVNGSYCLANQSFAGTQSGPWIDMWGSHPGEHWVAVTDDDSQLAPSRVLVTRYEADARAVLRASYGDRPLRQP